MSDEDQIDTADDAATGDDGFFATDQDLDDMSDNADDDADIDDPGDGDDSDDLYAGLTLSDADRDDVGGVDEDEPNVIEPMTDAQLLEDEKIRAKNRRDPARVVDNLNEQTGPRIAAARWAQYQEAERQASIDATNPDAEAEREAKAIAGVEEWMRVEDLDEGPGYISGEGSEHDHAEDAQRRKNAEENWRAFCNDPDS